jgi:exodeoxyribonuclease VII small subunit
MTDTDDLAALSYEELVEMLEDLTRRIASGEVGIEEASELYERAGVIHRLAAERLAQVRARIERLDGA